MKKLSIATMIILLTGCTTQTYVISDQSASQIPAYDEMQTFFVSGIGQKQQIDAKSVCNGESKVAKIQTQQTFLNGFLGALSSGIYTPRDMRVYCKYTENK